MPRFPLEGVRVLDFTHFVAGPHCTMWLASLGAEVLKIESPRRPDAFRLSQLRAGIEPSLNNSPIFVTTNLGKKSVAVDISTREGQEICQRIASASDVVTANFRPGVLEHFNLDYAVLSKINPSIVMAAITGYGYYSDYAAFQALGPNIHAFAGLSHVTGYVDGPPENWFSTYADVVVGHVTALSILAALGERERTGEGVFIDTAMSEALISVAPAGVLHAAMIGSDLERRGNEEPGRAPHGCYPCRGDDRWIAIATFDEADWHSLVQILGVQRLAADPRFGTIDNRWRNRLLLDEELGNATRGWDAFELAALLQQSMVAASPTRTAKDILQDDDLAREGFLRVVDQPELGPALQAMLPWSLEPLQDHEHWATPAPGFGTHTYEVLRDLAGVDDDEWCVLLERGVVAGRPTEEAIS